MKTETLTEDMIRALRDEAGASGDNETAVDCEVALRSTMHEGEFALGARHRICAVINNARGMDDSQTFVRVVP